MVKRIRIEINPLKDTEKELLEVARKLDRGEDVSLEKIVFDNYEIFRKTLTPERLRILHVIKEKDPDSIYELVKILGRDRRNVVRDLELLESLGLVTFIEENKGRRRIKKPVVTYDEIDVSIPIVV